MGKKSEEKISRLVEEKIKAAETDFLKKYSVVDIFIFGITRYNEKKERVCKFYMVFTKDIVEKNLFTNLFYYNNGIFKERTKKHRNDIYFNSDYMIYLHNMDILQSDLEKLHSNLGYAAEIYFSGNANFTQSLIDFTYYGLKVQLKTSFRSLDGSTASSNKI
jgi:hypothetical protein